MPSLAFVVDVINQRLVKSFGINLDGTLPPLTQGGTYDCIIRPVIPTNQTAAPFVDADYADYAFFLGLGVLNSPPKGGTFTLAAGSDPSTPTTDLAYNASAATVSAALNLLPDIVSQGGVTVATATTAGNPWQVTWNEVGARDLLVVNASELIPRSGADVNQSAIGDGTTQESQTVYLLQTPSAYNDDWDALPDAAGLVSDLVVGDGDSDAVQRIKLDPLPYGGTFAVRCLGKLTTQIPFGDDGTALQAALESLSSVGAGNVSVVQSGSCQWDVTFVGDLGEQAITAMTVNVAGLQVPLGVSGTLDLNVAGIDSLVQAKIRSVSLQIDVTPPGGKRFTIVSTTATLVASLFAGTFSPPTPTADYYTATEVDSAIAGAKADCLQIANNLSDVANAATARTNLGLGTVATLAVDTDGTLAANSDVKVASQKAVKTAIAAVSSYVTVSTPTTGQTVTGANTAGDELLEIEPAGTLATLTVALEAADALAVGTIKRVAFGAAITALVVQTGTGGAGTIKSPVTVSAAADAAIAYQKIASNTWRRVY